MFNKKIKNFFKKNLNKILVLVIYVIMFYGVSNLLSIILKDFAVEHNQQLLCSTIINVFLYGVLLASCLILLKTEIKTDFEVLNKTNALTVFYICLVGVGAAYLGNAIGSFITQMLGGGGESQNQQGIEALLFSKYGIIIVIVVIFIGPVVEELVFRKSIHNALRSMRCPVWLMLIISSVLFGLIHVLDGGDFVEVFPYILMGVVLGGIEIFSKNIYPAIFVHMFLNAMSTAMILYLDVLERSGLIPGV